MVRLALSVARAADAGIFTAVRRAVRGRRRACPMACVDQCVVVPSSSAILPCTRSGATTAPARSTACAEDQRGWHPRRVVDLPVGLRHSRRTRRATALIQIKLARTTRLLRDVASRSSRLVKRWRTRISLTLATISIFKARCTSSSRRARRCRPGRDQPPRFGSAAGWCTSTTRRCVCVSASPASVPAARLCRRRRGLATLCVRLRRSSSGPRRDGVQEPDRPPQPLHLVLLKPDVARQCRTSTSATRGEVSSDLRQELVSDATRSG